MTSEGLFGSSVLVQPMYTTPSHKEFVLCIQCAMHVKRHRAAARHHAVHRTLFETWWDSPELYLHMRMSGVMLTSTVGAKN